MESDGGSSLGVIVKDVISFRSYSNSRVLSPCVTLGCGYDQIPGPSNPFLDGVLALGKGRSSIVSQLSSQGLVGTRPLLEYTWWWISLLQ